MHSTLTIFIVNVLWLDGIMKFVCRTLEITLVYRSLQKLSYSAKR